MSPVDSVNSSGINCLLSRSGPFQRKDFEPSSELLKECARVLVIGAGGLGCELLKNLALMGFGQLDVIDMDTIDLSNLNRQFLFRPADIGKAKAEVAANFVKQRIASSCKITAHVGKIQDFDRDFYRQFNVVVCGLDSIIARRWINSMLASLVVYDDQGKPDPASIIPLVDGGTEGFKGHVMVVIYGLTGCVECGLDLYPPQVNFPLCTIANTPRLPEHCIEYVRLLLWSKENPFGADVPIDGDSPDHIQWIHDQSVERANKFGITGINLRLVQGVVKNIIPAVASTNAVVAAACATEVFKLVTFCYPYLDNYMNFSDLEGVYTYSFSIERKSDCLACNDVAQPLRFSPNNRLSEVLEFLRKDPNYQMQSPSITTTSPDGSSRSLFVEVAGMVEVLRDNLEKTLQELNLEDRQLVYVSDSTTPRTLSFRLILSPEDATKDDDDAMSIE